MKQQSILLCLSSYKITGKRVHKKKVTLMYPKSFDRNTTITRLTSESIIIYIVIKHRSSFCPLFSGKISIFERFK